MDPVAFDMGIWIGIAVVAIPVAALISFLVVYRQQTLIIDGRLIDAARRKAFDRIADFKCSDRVDADLEEEFCEIAIDCIVEAYLVFNPETKTKPEKLRRRFGAIAIVIGNSCVLRMYFGKHLEGQERDALNVPVDRELRLKKPTDTAPNGGGIKTKPAPIAVAPSKTQKPESIQAAGKVKPGGKRT